MSGGPATSRPRGSWMARGRRNGDEDQLFLVVAAGADPTNTAGRQPGYRGDAAPRESVALAHVLDLFGPLPADPLAPADMLAGRLDPLQTRPIQSCLTASLLKALLDHLNHLGRHAGVFVHHQVSQPPVQFRRDSAMQHRNIRCRGLFTEGLPPFLVIR